MRYQSLDLNLNTKNGDLDEKLKDNLSEFLADISYRVEKLPATIEISIVVDHYNACLVADIDYLEEQK